MKKNNILGGIVLILVAVFLIANGMEMFPDIPQLPWFKVLLTLFFGAGIISGVRERHFVGPSLLVCLIAWVWDDYLGITAITPFPLVLAGLLVGIGLNMMFREQRRVHVSFNDREDWHSSEGGGINYEESCDGRHVKFENNFNSVSKYVNAEAFSSARLENNFGSANIYFNNAVIANGTATINVENNFGETNLYFPKTWRIRLTQSSAFGSVNTYGSGNNDMDAPLIVVDAESNFGAIKIYFE